ncbi:MAG: hypothetical protein AWU58_1834 [Methanohalophilus sp. T328-1]|nr:MAG: hypothetical protein AWU58_1834 [Methanohalophilus sp. T328-1]
MIDYVTIPFYHGCLCQRRSLQDPKASGFALPFPFITGAYVNTRSRVLSPLQHFFCYHSLLSRVLMSTQYTHNGYIYYWCRVTIPFYHGCLCQLTGINFCSSAPVWVGYHSLLSRVLMSTESLLWRTNYRKWSYHSLLSRVLMSTGDKEHD